jgi:DNA-binding transcriptional MerR regulator
VSARSYLSIGDVLTLLRQEFPDVTISKIRFLESQGLVNPERTPSGYRKFYEHDVERLRWVLRQQREHFLPLKVIKDRLDDDSGGSGSARSSASTASRSKSPASASSADGNSSALLDEDHAEEPVLVGQRTSSESGAGAVDSRTGGEPAANTAGEGPTLPGIETARNTVPTPGGTKASAPPRGSSPNVSHPAAVGVSTAHRVTSSDRPAAPGSADHGAAAGKASSKPAARTPVSASSTGPPPRRSRAAQGSHSDPAAPAVGSPPPVTAAEERATSRGAPPPSPPSDSAPVDLNGASLSVDELSAACGLEVIVLLELQEYGLLTSMTVAGLEYFDDEALAVATLAARFARFGIEPRHLRLYKNAADREAGFVEQVVLPLVRQRNPDARARAQETADELAQLGQELRSALLRRALGDLLNG